MMPPMTVPPPGFSNNGASGNGDASQATLSPHDLIGEIWVETKSGEGKVCILPQNSAVFKIFKHGFGIRS